VPNYNATLSEFKKELQRLMALQEHTGKQIGNILRAMESIEILAKESDEPILQPEPMPPDEEAGFTDKVRAILRANSWRPLTAVEIRDVILGSSPDADPKVMLIHTHNTLKRLHKQQEVDESDTADGRKAYKLKGFDFLSALAGIKATPLPEISPSILEILGASADKKKK
jgi:hypothetical protein